MVRPGCKHLIAGGLAAKRKRNLAWAEGECVSVHCSNTLMLGGTSNAETGAREIIALWSSILSRSANGLGSPPSAIGTSLARTPGAQGSVGCEACEWRACASVSPTNSETGIASFDVATIAPGFPLAHAAAIPLEIVGPVR
jgi:hypothetical protein